MYDNENGTEPRAKFRIRTYNNALEHISLELKQKQHGMTYKRSCLLTRQQAQKLLSVEDMNLEQVHHMSVCPLFIAW